MGSGCATMLVRKEDRMRAPAIRVGLTPSSPGEVRHVLGTQSEVGMVVRNSSSTHGPGRVPTDVNAWSVSCQTYFPSSLSLGVLAHNYLAQRTVPTSGDCSHYQRGIAQTQWIHPLIWVWPASLAPG